MGKQKKGFNWKARQQPEMTEPEKSTAETLKKEVKVDLNLKQNTGYEDSNMLVVSAASKKKKKQLDPSKVPRRLTKKQRKQLEKIVEQKEKKVKRASVLESLAAHQASKEEMGQLVGIAEVQTGQLKRKLHTAHNQNVKVNVISGCNKKKRRLEMAEEDSSESEESVHTSDMSTDEEDEEGEEDVDSEQSAGSENVTEENNETDSAVLTESKDSKKDKLKDKLKDKPKDKLKDKLKDSSDKEIKASGGKWSSKTVEDDNKSQGKGGDKTGQVEEVSRPAAAAAVKPSSGRKVVHVPVKRTDVIQEGRLKLPILGEEQVVMESIIENPVVIIAGETGSGKTTQVPQFLYEAGYAHGGGIIGVTEPRRVAAISMSNRVAKEMSLSSREVSYQIRYEGNVTPDTKIKFMTDGVLLKEVQKDFMLTKYSVVIIDEAHERSMYTDILIGLLSRIVPLRHKRGNPLKLVIMSATLRVEDFTENRRLFKTVPPVIKVDSRQFPVTIHYNKRTPLDDYLNEAYRKTCKIHRMLPAGGILVFVTGQQEVHTLCKKLRHTFPTSTADNNIDTPTNSFSQKKKSKQSKPEKHKKHIELPKISLDSYSVAPVDEEDAGEGGTSDLDLSDNEGDLGVAGGNEMGEDSEEEGDGEAGGCSQPLYVLPLYSMLASDKQAKVFEPAPEGYRLCVVATNVAETSLTIPNIKYVVDTGKVKTKFYDKVTGVSTFRVTWTSKAGANQRAGRAGRVGPGHSYRLYSSAVFNDEFEKFSEAEITRRPVDDLVLQMKDMNIDKVLNFPYPTPPDPQQIRAAEMLLLNLGAVTKTTPSRKIKGQKKELQTTICPLGRAMACFPVAPRYAKMLALGHQQNLLPYVVVIVAALSVQELFVELYGNHGNDDAQSERLKQKLIHMSEMKRRWAAAGHSLLLGDLMVMLKAVGACEYAGASEGFCEEHGIRPKAMKEVRKLRMQLTNTVNAVIPDANVCVDPKMAPPDDVQAKLLRQIVLAGMGDHVARKMPEMPPTDKTDKAAKMMKHAYQCMDLEDPVFIHPTSVLYRQKPDFVIYQSIEETSRLYMKGVVAVKEEWLPVFAPGYANMSKPLETPAPDYDPDKGQVTCHMTGTFGPCCWPLPAVQMEHPASLEKMKWFARFLLEGRVVMAMAKFHGDLLSSPATMVKTWAKLQPRTEVLLNSLIKERVDSKDSLMKVWDKQPEYLLSAMKEWIPQSKHAELTALWPPR